MPTLLDLTGNHSAIPKGIDGISMAPTLLGQSQPPRPYLYREFPSYGGQQAIRVGDWKAIRQNMSKGNLEVELYNLAKDVSESHNVASEYPEKVAELTRMMEQVRTPSKDFPLVPLDAPVKKRKKR